MVISVAVHVPGAVLVPAVAVQVAGVPSAVAPFMNVTVPVGPAALLFVPVTFAVSVTLPPELMLVALERHHRGGHLASGGRRDSDRGRSRSPIVTVT